MKAFFIRSEVSLSTSILLCLVTLLWGFCSHTWAGNSLGTETGLVVGEIRSLVTDPAAPATLYAGNNNGGVISYAPPPPACGSSNGSTLTTTPTDLCQSGTPSAVAGSGPWTWSCTGSEVPAYCIANIRTVTYSQSDLTGRWESNSLASGPGAPWWGRGSFTVAANGSATGTFVESDGNTDTIAKTFSLAADGTVTVAGSNPTMSCKLDSSKTFIVCTDIWSSWMPGTVELFVMTKMANTTYAITDLAGTWSFINYEAPGLYWKRGVATVSGGGAYSMTSEASDGGQYTETGALEISASGIVTRTGVSINSSRCVLDALRTILVCTSTNGSGSTSMQILTKNGASYNQSNLVGVWNYSNIASPDQWYGRGMANFASDGNVSLSFYGSEGVTYSHAGPYNISPNGSIIGASPSGSCSMDSLKRFVTCVTFNSKRTNADLMIYTSTRPPSAPSAMVNGACGSSNRQTFVSAPTGNLCLDGAASAVAGSGPWTWSCQGANGGDDAFCIANKQTMTFSTADMVGIWMSNGIESPGPWWSRGTFTIGADGSFMSTDLIASDGPRPPLSGSYIVSSDGIMTAPTLNPSFRCVIDPAMTVNTCTDTNNNGKELNISLRKAASYALSDLQGTWESHALGTPGPYWSHGNFTVAADGTSSATVTQNNGSTTSFSGTFSMPSSGIFTLYSPQLQPNEQATMRCVLDSLKTVMVCTYSHDSSGSLETTMWIYVKKASVYSQSDLTGAWQINNLVSPTNAWWGRGMFAFASDGSFAANMEGSDGPGDIMSFTGTSTFTSNGNFAFDGVPTMHCSMDAAKRLVVCTNTSTTGSGDATILVMMAATAPLAGLCGPSSGISTISAPTADLCSAGTPSSISGSGPWSWSCLGRRGGGTASCSAPVTQRNLVVSVSGPGSVTSSPAGIACASGPGGSCSASFDHGRAVTLLPLGSNSTFVSWSGDLTDSTNPGSITMDSNKTVTATFTPDPAKVKIDGYAAPYYTIGSALEACGQDGTVRAQAAPLFAEIITMTNPATILFRGGFTNTGFTDIDQSGYTTISGWLKICSGKLTVERLKIKP